MTQSCMKKIFSKIVEGQKEYFYSIPKMLFYRLKNNYWQITLEQRKII